MVKVTLYTRARCHLCEVAKDVIDAARRERPFEFEVVDIDADPALVALYTEEVPVIAVGGRKAFKYRTSVEALLARVARAEADEGSAP